jgi:hypothetical protein
MDVIERIEPKGGRSQERGDITVIPTPQSRSSPHSPYDACKGANQEAASR